MTGEERLYYVVSADVVPGRLSRHCEVHVSRAVESFRRPATSAQDWLDSEDGFQ